MIHLVYLFQVENIYVYEFCPTTSEEITSICLNGEANFGRSGTEAEWKFNRNFVRRSGLFTEFFEAEWKFYGTELIRSAKLAGIV